jgi:polysaccharide biosynthesis PFTS motif protein
MLKKCPYREPANDLLKSQFAENAFKIAYSIKKVNSEHRVMDHIRLQQSWFSYIFPSIKYASILLLLPLILLAFLARKIYPYRPFHKNIKYCVRSFQKDYGYTFGEGRTIDFVIDDNLIKNEEVLFCGESPYPDETYKEEFSKRNRNYCDARNCIPNVPLRCLLEIAIIWPRLVIGLPFATRVDMQTMLEIIHKYILWNGFVNTYHPRLYLFYGDYTPTAVIRDVIFSQNRIEAWYYCNSSSYWNVYAGGESEVERIHAYYICDKALTWGDAMKNYIPHTDDEPPPVDIKYSGMKSVENTGCLWAEKIDEMRRKYPKKDGITISVFDTSYGHGYSVMTNDDMIEFLNDILKLADEMPEATFLFKMKFTPYMETRSEMFEMYNRIKRHPRIKFSYDPAIAIASSDLVISACYTSTTTEAWAAGVRAIYHDARDTITSNLYDSIPNAVSNNYEELKKLVHYWLHQNSNEEFQLFREKYIKGQIDAYIDCKGITHLREMMIR